MLPTFEPIGLVRSPFIERADVPRQPRAARGIPGRLELLAGRGFEDALQDLETWSHLWALFWFHRAQGWRPKVQPPRSQTRRGLFATRAPYRPNAIGMSALKIVSVEGLTVHVEDVDILDGTPLLDIKPYVPYTDAIVDATGGWLEEERERSVASEPVDPGPAWTIRFEERASSQLAYLASHGVLVQGIELREAIVERLRLGPHPHAYRRIRREGDRGTLAIKAWRVAFQVQGDEISVLSLRSGYRKRVLSEEGDPEVELHRQFEERFR